jgi:hypothetical protein
VHEERLCFIDHGSDEINTSILESRIRSLGPLVYGSILLPKHGTRKVFKQVLKTSRLIRDDPRPGSSPGKSSHCRVLRCSSVTELW